MDLEISENDKDDIYDGIEDHVVIGTMNLISTLEETISSNENSLKFEENLEILNKEQYLQPKSSELDLYSELLQADNEHKRLKAEKEKEAYDNLLRENRTLKCTNDVLEKELELYKKENDMLKHNISSLYKAAKTELDFKNDLILELRTELDEYLFRRKVDKPHRSSDKQNRHRSKSKSKRNCSKPETPVSNQKLVKLNANPEKNASSVFPSIVDGFCSTENASSTSSSESSIQSILEKAFDEFAERQVVASTELLDAVRSFDEQQMGLVEKLKEAALIVFNGKKTLENHSSCNSFYKEKVNINESHNDSSRKRRKIITKSFSDDSKKDIFKLYSYQNSDVPYVVRKKTGLSMKNPEVILKTGNKPFKPFKFVPNNVTSFKNSSDHQGNKFQPQSSVFQSNANNVHQSQNLIKSESKNSIPQSNFPDNKTSSNLQNFTDYNESTARLYYPNKNFQSGSIFDWSSIMSETSIADSIKQTRIMKDKIRQGKSCRKNNKVLHSEEKEIVPLDNESKNETKINKQNIKKEEDNISLKTWGPYIKKSPEKNLNFDNIIDFALEFLDEPPADNAARTRPMSKSKEHFDILKKEEKSHFNNSNSEEKMTLSKQMAVVQLGNKSKNETKISKQDVENGEKLPSSKKSSEKVSNFDIIDFALEFLDESPAESAAANTVNSKEHSDILKQEKKTCFDNLKSEEKSLIGKMKEETTTSKKTKLKSKQSNKLKNNS